MEAIYKITTDNGYAIICECCGHLGIDPCEYSPIGQYKKMTDFLKEAEKDGWENVKYGGSHEAPKKYSADNFLDWLRKTHPEFKFDAEFVGDKEEIKRWNALPPDSYPSEHVKLEDVLPKEVLEDLMRSIKNNHDEMD